MTPEERKQAFQRDLTDLCDRYGYYLDVKVNVPGQASVLSGTTQIAVNMAFRAEIEIKQIPGWQPPAETETE